MSYAHLSDLPTSVQDHLPLHAQEIYRAADNNAWEEYQDPKSRNKDDTQEATAHKVAWSTVKNQYKKAGGNWQKI